MKKIYVLVFILSFVLYSCTGQPTEPQKVIADNEKVFETDSYILEKIDFPSVPGFLFNTIKWLDEDHLFVILHKDPLSSTESPEEQLKKKIFIISLKNKSTKSLYEGELQGSGFNIYAKNLSEGNIGLQGSDWLLVFDKDTFEVVRNIPFPKGSFQGDVSYDGKQIVFVNSEGLFVSPIDDSSDAKQLAKTETNNDGRSFIAPTLPVWSYDNKKILYFTYTQNEENEIHIVDADGSNHQVYKFSEGWLGWWFHDSQRVVAYGGSGSVEGSVAQIKVIDTGSGKVLHFEREGDIHIESPPSGEQVLYEQRDAVNREGVYWKRLVVFNVVTGEEEVVTPDFFDVTSSGFSPSGQAIAFIGLPNSGEMRNIYIAHKKIKQ